MRKRIVVYSLLVILAGLVFLPSLPVKQWDGFTGRTLVIKVVAKGGGVIEGAKVTWTAPTAVDPEMKDSVTSSGTTDSKGSASLDVSLPCGGRRILGFNVGGEVWFSKNIRVEARGYRAFEVPLGALAGPMRTLRDKRPIPIAIELEKQ